MNLKRLYDLREAHDLSQREIAKVLKVSQQTYSLWENGIKIIPLKHLHDLANYYQVSIDYLLSLSNDKRKLIASPLNRRIIGQNIKNFRKKYNLTLRDLAKELNTTSSTISAYETGKTLILTAFIYQIAIKYHLSIDELLDRKTKKIVKIK